jgi:hypothetical protein
VPEIEIVKMSTGGLRGFTQTDEERREKYRRFIDELAPGEFFHLRYWQEPDPVLHRKLMALFRLGFDHWDPAANRKRLTYKGAPIEKNFDQFRKEVLIQAGFFEASYDAKGRVHLEAKSLAFGKMTDEEKKKAFDSVVNVLLERVLTNYNRDDLEHVVEQLQRFGQ